MLQILNIDELERRAALLRLSLGELAKAAGFAASTPYRWKQRGVSPTLRTLRAMTVELVRREREMRAHLDRVQPGQPEAAE